MAIERLAQSVADAIAAGEVVERPASVVKELCENAVDAGARRLDVVIDGGGTVRVRVTDDGCGIPAAQLTLAVARHATSKIHSAADLESVTTMGFRGEALASIAAVADLTMHSRPTEQRSGARLRVRHGEVVEEGPWGGPQGTTVEVLDLFAATPARLRFLRSQRAEAAAAIAVVSDLVLIHPALIVTCTVDGRLRVRAPGGELDDALRCVFGDDANELVPVAASGDINVGGAISEPRRHRGTRGGLVLIVNDRRVHNRALLAAVGDAYRGLIPGGRHPFGVVSVALDAAEVDVNVHPTKREVRFRDERAVFAAVQRACWSALRGAAVYVLPPAPAALHLADGDGNGTGAQLVGRSWPAGVAAGVRHAEGQRPGWPAAAPARPAGLGNDNLEGAVGGPDPPDAPARAAALADLGPLRSLGQQEGRWLVATSPLGIVIVDPHAAHEKVVYNELLAEWSGGSPSQQMLLIPELVDVDAATMERYLTHADLLAGVGFAVEPFGPSTLRCLAVPGGGRGSRPATLLLEVLDGLGGGPVSEQRHRAAAMVACHAAVRFGDELTAEEQQRLLDRLVVTGGGLTCPHGRPTLVLLDEPGLRRMFRRPAL